MGRSAFVTATVGYSDNLSLTRQIYILANFSSATIRFFKTCPGELKWYATCSLERVQPILQIRAKEKTHQLRSPGRDVKNRIFADLQWVKI